MKAEALQVLGHIRSQTSVPVDGQPSPSARRGPSGACTKGPHTSASQGQVCGRAPCLLHLGSRCAPPSSLNVKKQPSRLHMETALVLRIQAGPPPCLCPHTPHLNGHRVPGATPSWGASLHLGSVAHCPQLSDFQIQ